MGNTSIADWKNKGYEKKLIPFPYPTTTLISLRDKNITYLNYFLFRPTCGGGTIYSNGFFCSVNFGRSIYSS